MVLACAIMATMLLSGCESSGGGGSAGFYGDSGGFDVADSGGDVYYSGGGDGSGGNAVNPEPATMAMLGSGLLAYGLLKRKKKK